MSGEHEKPKRDTLAKEAHGKKHGGGVGFELPELEDLGAMAVSFGVAVEGIFSVSNAIGHGLLNLLHIVV